MSSITLFCTNAAISEPLQGGALSGSLEIGGPTAVDPSPDEPRNTHFRIHLTGDAAKAFYDSMPVDVKPSICTDGLSKTMSDMECAMVDGEYECWFAINIEAQSIQGGWAC